MDPILIVILDSDVEFGFEIRKNEGCLDHGLLSLHSENLHSWVWVDSWIVESHSRIQKFGSRNLILIYQGLNKVLL